MTKSKRSRKAHAKNAGGGYDVGYGKPPKETQFEPGHSGNPKGRPKGAQNADTLARKILSRIILRFAERALSGEAKAADFLLKLYRPDDGGSSEGDMHDPNDREIFDLLLRELEAKQQPKSKEPPDD